MDAAAKRRLGVPSAEESQGGMKLALELEGQPALSSAQLTEPSTPHSMHPHSVSSQMADS